jgi:23S rRNA (uracil1939-C5)-methyltransferase
VKKKKKQVILKDVLITNYAAEGKAIAKVDGKVIFVEQCVPGDVVDIQLGKNKKSWAEAWPTAFKTYSKDRVEPFCKHFGVCGGCHWQMLPYEHQLNYKQQQVVDHLQRFGHVKLPELLPIVGATKTQRYRNKVEYTFSTKQYISFQDLRNNAVNSLANQKGFAGFHAKGFFEKVVHLNECHLQEEPTNAIRNAVVDFCLKNDYPFYDIKFHEGWLRNLMVRMLTTGDIMVNVIIAYEDKTMIDGLLGFMLKQFPEITTLVYTVNSKLNDSIGDLSPITFFGKGFATEQLTTNDGDTYTYNIGPKSFFQTNTQQGEVLYNITKNFAELNGNQIVYDLYCGTGSIGIFVSKQAKKIIGVEVIKEAIDDAKINASMNNISNAHFFAGDVIDICNDDFFKQHGRPDVIITDPPRVGMHEKLVNKLLEIAAPLVVYVSCNPATQARDLALLDAKYEVTKVQPVDMFPHTHHIENVVQLRLRKN